MIRRILAAIVALVIVTPFGTAHATMTPAEIRAHTVWLLEMMASLGGSYLRYEGYEKDLIREAKEVLANKMRDPESVQWHHVRIVDHADGKLVCGEYNARNVYGGYVGFRVFAANDGVVQLESINLDREKAAAVNEPLFDVCGR